MAVCAKCGNQDLEFKEGIGKNTGKPWKAWYCAKCKLMHGMNGMPWGDKPKSPVAQPQKQFSQPEVHTSTLERKLDTILEILKENFPPLKDEVVSEEDSSPF